MQFVTRKNDKGEVVNALMTLEKEIREGTNVSRRFLESFIPQEGYFFLKHVSPSGDSWTEGYNDGKMILGDERFPKGRMDGAHVITRHAIFDSAPGGIGDIHFVQAYARIVLKEKCYVFEPSDGVLCDNVFLSNINRKFQRKHGLTSGAALQRFLNQTVHMTELALRSAGGIETKDPEGLNFAQKILHRSRLVPMVRVSKIVAPKWPEYTPN